MPVGFVREREAQIRGERGFSETRAHIVMRDAMIHDVSSKLSSRVPKRGLLANFERIIAFPVTLETLRVSLNGNVPLSGYVFLITVRQLL